MRQIRGFVYKTLVYLVTPVVPKIMRIFYNSLLLSVFCLLSSVFCPRVHVPAVRCPRVHVPAVCRLLSACRLPACPISAYLRACVSAVCRLLSACRLPACPISACLRACVSAVFCPLSACLPSAVCCPRVCVPACSLSAVCCPRVGCPRVRYPRVRLSVFYVLSVLGFADFITSEGDTPKCSLNTLLK
jgi:hypothetical protein